MSRIVSLVLTLATLQAFHAQAQTCSPIQSYGPAILVDGPCATDASGKIVCDPDATVRLTYPWVLENPALPSCKSVTWLFADGTVQTPTASIERTFAQGKQTIAATIANGNGTNRSLALFSMYGYFYWPSASGPVPVFHENQGPATLVVARSDARFSSTIDYETYLPSQYVVPTSGTLTFEPGETSKTISIPLVNDSVWAGDRIEKVIIRNATNGYSIVSGADPTVSNSRTEMFKVIEDEPVTYHRCVPAHYTVLETAGEATITMVRSGNLAVESTGVLDILQAESWYSQPRRFEVPFAPGETTKTIKMPVEDDAYFNVNRGRTFTCNGFVNGVGGGPPSTEGSLSITEDEPYPTFAVSGTDLTETDGTLNTGVPVTVTPPFGTPTTVNLYWESRSTLQDVYLSNFTLGRGTASATAPVRVVGDDVYEATQSGQVRLYAHDNTRTVFTLTLHDDDAPPYEFAFRAASHTVPEIAPSLTLDRTGDTSGASSGKVYLRPDDASTLPSKAFIVTFAAGETSKTFLLPIENDSWYTGDRSATVDVLFDQVVMATTRVTVQDDEPMPVFSVEDIVVEEGKAAELTMSFSGPVGVPLGVRITMHDGTAIRGVDYNGFDTTLSIEPGRPVLKILVGALADFEAEPDETFTIVISNCCGRFATLGKSTAVVTIKDAEPPTYLKFYRPIVKPLRESDGWLTATIVRSGDLSKTTTATVRDCCGDYASLIPVSTIFQPGETKRAVSLWINDDVYSGDPRPIQLELLKDGVVTDSEWVSVDEDEPRPLFRIEDAWIAEGNGGGREMVFTISILPADTQPCAMQVSTIAGGTAQPGADFESRTELIEFATRQKTQTFRVPVLGDAEPESDETFTVSVVIYYPFRGIVGKHTAIGTIVDDDRVRATLSPAAVNVAKGDAIDLLIEFNQPLAAAGVVALASSDPAVLGVPASIDVAAGSTRALFTATAREEGFARVVVTLPSGGGTLMSEVIVYVLRTPLVEPQALLLDLGATSELELRATPDAGADLPVTIAAHNNAIVAVQPTASVPAGGGVRIPVLAKAAGTTIIDITFPDQNGATVSVQVTVTDPSPPPPKKRRAARH